MSCIMLMKLLCCSDETKKRAKQMSEQQPGASKNEEVRDKERSADAEREMDKQDAQTNNA